jgi:hypothetical protein
MAGKIEFIMLETPFKPIINGRNTLINIYIMEGTFKSTLDALSAYVPFEP